MQFQEHQCCHNIVFLCTELCGILLSLRLHKVNNRNFLSSITYMFSLYYKTAVIKGDIVSEQHQVFLFNAPQICTFFLEVLGYKN
jgi:hypothetical protein